MNASDELVGNGSMVAHDLRDASRALRFAPGRRCVADGCRTILSSYNPADRCWAHLEATPVLSLGMRRPRAQEGPRVLDHREELAMIEALTGRRTIRPRRVRSQASA